MGKLNRQARIFSRYIGLLFLAIGVILLFTETVVSGSSLSIQEGSTSSHAVNSGGAIEWWGFIGLGLLCFFLSLFIFVDRPYVSSEED
ncbi:hypothetical protein [Phaeocystidibacter marisrubri]|uniref:Uncharacterized protein n=1 Tax=Phaeocystidibacter marisrubri TaxID=1577780 RepID=A0A6L3ZEX1_9FLAO|nr:hypothetical protein [Phaeocystidibacter marisrubri]KAB2816371.1 hypothetical protein F8C82_11855 [Phaeocystidibacter marisrubri]